MIMNGRVLIDRSPSPRGLSAAMRNTIDRLRVVAAVLLEFS
jgi:hypothetical protein